jgi:hypothetical protein
VTAGVLHGDGPRSAECPAHQLARLPTCPVSRIEATSPALSMALTLDINSDIFPLAEGDRITVCIASSLFGSAPAAGGMDGEEEEGGVARREAWRGGDEGLASEFDYVVYGKVRLRPAWLLHPGIGCGREHGEAGGLRSRGRGWETWWSGSGGAACPKPSSHTPDYASPAEATVNTTLRPGPVGAAGFSGCTASLPPRSTHPGVGRASVEQSRGAGQIAGRRKDLAVCNLLPYAASCGQRPAAPTLIIATMIVLQGLAVGASQRVCRGRVPRR